LAKKTTLDAGSNLDRCIYVDTSSNNNLKLTM